MRVSLIALTGLLCTCSALAADPPGSRDPEGVPRFPQAEIVDFSEAAAVERTYPQGAIRRISNRVRYERRIDAKGRQVAATYLLPPGHAADEAFASARKALLDQGAEPLYWCQGRDCGSSSLWANAVFDNATLYGADDEQAFLLLRLTEPHPAEPALATPRDSLVALYAITRGNRRAYLRVERLEAEAPLGELLPTAATLLRELRASGELNLPRLADGPQAPWLDLLAQTLRADTTLRVALAGPQAERWREALVEAGIRAARLELDDGATASSEPSPMGLRLIGLR